MKSQSNMRQRMASHNQVAKSVREDKEAHPERYCSLRSCLWKTAVVGPDGGYILNADPCRKHPVATPSSKEITPETRALAEDTFSRIEKSNEAQDQFARR
jgi:hypothetical protein